MRTYNKKLNAERNKKIIDDILNGVPIAKILDLYELGENSIKKILTEYRKLNKVPIEKPIQNPIKNPAIGFGLYAERDFQIRQNLHMIFKSVPKSSIHTVKQPDTVRAHKFNAKG